jgi:MoaA/NifB/PqqE/SkfB family radical SAM enzyme
MKPHHYPLRVLSNRLGLVSRPSYVTYLVCDRCNARCGMCDSWRMPRGVELTPAQVQHMFGKLGSLDAVRLSGGEPFLRADLLELAEAVMSASTPGVLHVTTNGSFPDRIERFARQFSRPRRLHVMVSFDGMPSVHDASRGRKVSFERALASVDALARLRPLGVGVSVNHTIISRRSLRDHAPLAALMAERGVDTQWVLAYSASSMYAQPRRGKRAEDLVLARGYPLHPELDAPESLDFAREQLNQLGHIRSPLLRLGKRYYLEGLVARLAGEEAPRPKPKCVALRSHLRLLPDGTVVVCQFNTERMGNLFEQSLDEIWHAPRTKSSRAWADACTGCWAECEVMPNAIYSGDLVSHALGRAVTGLRRTPPVQRKRGVMVANKGPGADETGKTSASIITTP